MAVLELQTIYGYVRTVLEGSPFYYTLSTDAISHDRDPNRVIGTTYVLEDAGVQAQTPTTNYSAARIDRINLWLARKVGFAPSTALDTMVDDMLDIERYLKANGRTNGYHVELVGRRITRKPESDVLVGSLTLSLDYDVSEAVA